MKPCDELKNIVLRHYGKFDSGEQADTIKETYLLQEGVTIIGNDPNEWFDDRDSILAFMQVGSSGKKEITVQNLKAYSEGSVGWTMVLAEPWDGRRPARKQQALKKDQFFHGFLLKSLCPTTLDE